MAPCASAGESTSPPTAHTSPSGEAHAAWYDCGFAPGWADAAEAIGALRALGCKLSLLSGDAAARTNRLARQLGFDEAIGAATPQGKLQRLAAAQQLGERVAMVGDGVNDAPSLAAAYVSVAMGARGSDAALEQSDVVLMQDKIEKLLSARRISEHARRIIQQNIFISLGSVIVMAVASLFGIVPLTLGVLTHEGSTVVVCLNSLRLLFEKE